MRACVIALKGNILILVFTAFVSTMEPVTFAHALERLQVPSKLTLLLLFTIRYLSVLDEEYKRLRGAMAMRVFTPSFSVHTFRSLGHLVGMLLVRSLDRSERIHDAMKCRGFRGIFPSFHDFRLRYRDGAFASAIGLMLVSCWWMGQP